MRKMKNSGIEWIGKIPSSWKIRKNKYLLDSMYSGGTPSVSNPNFYAVENGIPFVSISDMSSVDYVKTTKKSLTEEGVKDKNLTILPTGTVLYSIYATVGAVSELAIEATISQAMLALSIKPNQSKSYYKYCLSSMEKFIFGSANGNTQFNLNAEKVWNFVFPSPHLSEQKAISSFLDKQCAEIDAVIANTKETIVEYKKLKQSIITETVTKGIRGNRAMKNSGIEWIGHIPDNWEISRVKYVAIFEPYSDKSHLDEDSVITYTPMECIKNGYFINKTALLRNVSSSLTAYQEGDIVMAKVTPCFENGNIAIMNNLYSGFGLGSSELFVFRATNIITKYLFYWLRNDKFIQRACATMTGTGGLKRVSPTFIKDCYIHLPTIEEQNEIADYLDKKCAEIDTLISKKTALIEEMEAYKKSIIYEYVTGKKEVPNG